MTANTVATHSACAASTAVADGRVELETRFGVMSFDRANAIVMPRGLLGYAEHREFALANMPDPKLQQFKLLQCLSQPALSFVVVPADLESGILDPADIRAACRTLSVADQDVAVLLVVATRKIGAATQISVNLRAPVIVDTRNQTAWQFVLTNNRYPVRHVIGTVAGGPATASAPRSQPLSAAAS